jgi:YbgC/YbaW family acyl-CoA thioester hydrolase
VSGDPMASHFTLRRRVEFNETDAAGVVYYGNFFRYCEAAEAAFLRSLGLTMHRADCSYSWPRVDVKCRYFHPLRFEDEIEVHLWVARKRDKAIEYLFRIFLDPDKERVLAAEAYIIVVCVTGEGMTGKRHARTLPPELDGIIEEAPDAV